ASHLFAQLVDLSLLWIFLAKLLMDSLQLFAQEKLALTLFDPLLNLPAQFVAELEEVDFALEQCLQALVLEPQPIGLEELEAFLDVQPQAGSDQVEQSPRAVLVHRT